MIDQYRLCTMQSIVWEYCRPNIWATTINLDEIKIELQLQQDWAPQAVIEQSE